MNWRQITEFYRKRLIGSKVGTLNKLESQIDTGRMKAPAFKMILTATEGYAYLRPADGIYVVPIGCCSN